MYKKRYDELNDVYEAMLKNTHTNDTLADSSAQMVLPKIQFPNPNIRLAILPKSKGDEDVKFNLDGSERLITRSLQNWHTHLAMILNRGTGEDLPLQRWLNEIIFPTEKKLTAELVELGTKAACAELIATGTTFACDMYYFPKQCELQLPLDLILFCCCQMVCKSHCHKS